MSDADQCARCGGDCGMSECETYDIDQKAAELAFEDDWEPCSHDCDETVTTKAAITSTASTAAGAAALATATTTRRTTSVRARREASRDD